MFLCDTYNIEPTSSADMLALFTNFFYRCANFHCSMELGTILLFAPCCLSLESSDYSSFCLIVGTYLKRYAIPQKNSNIMEPHFSP